MKLVAIEHTRCNEYDKTAYYIAPDAMTENEIATAVNAAQIEYIEAVKNYAGLEKPVAPPTNYSSVTDDSKTVGQLKAELAEYGKKIAEFDKAKSIISGSFDDKLKVYGIVSLYEYSGADKVKCEADWGHRHGTNLRY